MLILLSHYMFIEVMRYVCMIVIFWKPIKCILRPTALFTNKAKRAFLITFCYAVLFYDVNFTISPLEKGFKDPLICLQTKLNGPF